MTDEDTLTEATEADVAPALEEEPRSGGGLFSRRFIVAVALATLAFIAAVVFGVLWWTASGSTEHEVSTAREAAEAAAKQGVLAYTEIDYKNPDAYRSSQQAIATDELFEQMQGDWTKSRKQIVDSQLSVKVRVYEVGVQQLDTRKGEAVALAAIKITRKAKSVDEQSGPLRLVVKLKRVGEDWKLADIADAPEVGNG